MTDIENPLSTSVHQWSTLRSELFWVYSGTVSEELRNLAVDHRHGYWLWLMREGSVKVSMDGKTWRARTGQWMLCPAGKMTQEFSADARILSLHFLCQWPAGEPLFAVDKGLVVDGKKHGRLTVCAEALQRMASRHFPGVRVTMFEQNASLEVFLKLQHRFVAFLIELVRMIKAQRLEVAYEWPMDQRVARAVQCLNRASLSEPMPIARLLKQTGLSRVHLDRMVSTQMGFSLREYWDRLRESTACSRLESTKQTSKEISYHLGFKQASHFTTWFKRRCQMTPEAYRSGANKRMIG
ncbi:MAG TPA: AraC family transcriptional regulator [Rariglobus sp.]